MSRARRAARVLALAACALGAGQRPPGLGDVTEIRVWDHETHTRVVIQLSRPAEYRSGTLDHPPRLYIDVEDTWIEAPLRAPRHERESVALRQVRGGQNTLTRARVVLELDTRGRSHRTFHLRNPFRIVTDVYRHATERGPDGRLASSFDERPVRRIAIDPGHGGKDPGAIGRKGLREKDVVLRVSRELARILDAQGYDAFLTRQHDRYLSLEERTALANRRGADLFLSIHANAARNRSMRGVETYLLDTRYDKQTARVAARENGTTVEQLGDLERILASLRLTYTERFASRLADHVQASLVESLRSHYSGTANLGVKRGPFLVLFMADMPAVLVELGFVSNRSEGERLRSRGFARAAARGIARGVSGYRDQHARSLVATR